MSMHHFFDPTRFGVEFTYTVLVVFLCFLVYYKTKSIYDLTKYKGIGYFRNAFLLFGLAYTARFILHFLKLTTITFDFWIPMRLIRPFPIILAGYFSTMAIVYLTYSIIWKKIRYDHFVVFSNTVAVVVSAIAFISRSHILLTLLQIILLAFALIISSIKYKKKKKRFHIRALYSLISVFWLINLFLVGPRRFLPFQFKIILQGVSLLVFFIIYQKVVKWTR